MKQSACRGFFEAAPMGRREFLRAGSLACSARAAAVAAGPRCDPRRANGRRRGIVLFIVGAAPLSRTPGTQAGSPSGVIAGEFKPIANHCSRSARLRTSAAVGPAGEEARRHPFDDSYRRQSHDRDALISSQVEACRVRARRSRKIGPVSAPSWLVSVTARARCRPTSR